MNILVKQSFKQTREFSTQIQLKQLSVLVRLSEEESIGSNVNKQN